MANKPRKSKKIGGWQIDSYMKKSKNMPINNNTRTRTKTRSSQKKQTIRQNKFTRKNNLLS